MGGRERISQMRSSLDCVRSDLPSPGLTARLSQRESAGWS
ncbi:hypothetical protein V7x_52300 [Crateriforma conspicua]|uniref:Uncharacterized protein n=1 Tax=Crateriforma conspicua TaxID=2527996 RepID=A0A5C6FLM2_9PLAN|nr:hypothetical protein V7x_52300 [Crateriforma conspicua]